MNKELIATQKIKGTGLLPLFYHFSESTCIKIMESLYSAGIRALEFTNRGEKAMDNFKAMVQEKNRSFPDLFLGTGTIHNGLEAKKFLEMGADFLVSPFFDPDIAEVASQNNLLWIPGCMTPTEIQRAVISGSRFIKIFPGNIVGPGFIEAIQVIFNGIDFIVTGGVDKDEQNLRSWIKSGVIAVGIGNKLISREILSGGKFDELELETKKVILTIESLRKN